MEDLLVEPTEVGEDARGVAGERRALLEDAEPLWNEDEEVERLELSHGSGVGETGVLCARVGGDLDLGGGRTWVRGLMTVARERVVPELEFEREAMREDLKVMGTGSSVRPAVIAVVDV